MTHIYKASFKYVHQSQEMRNVVHYAVDDSGVFDAPTATAVIGGHWDVNLKTFLSAGFQFYAIGWQNLSIADSVEEIVDFDPVKVGSSAGEAIPSQIALCCTLTSSAGTKPTRGRAYLAGFTKDAISAGLFGSGSVAAAEAFMSAISSIDVGGTNNAQLVIYSPTKSVPGALVYNTVNGYIGQDVPATQRRRRRGSGI